jgi:hypothetical protein
MEKPSGFCAVQLSRSHADFFWEIMNGIYKDIGLAAEAWRLRCLLCGSEQKAGQHSS